MSKELHIFKLNAVLAEKDIKPIEDNIRRQVESGVVVLDARVSYVVSYVSGKGEIISNTDPKRG